MLVVLSSDPASEAFMSTTVIPLQSLRVISTQGDVEVSSNLTLSVDCVQGVSDIASVDLLSDAVSKDNLWIARTGCCYIEVAVAVESEPVLERHHLHSFVKLIQQCDVWLANESFIDE